MHFLVELLVVILHTKFEVSSFSHYRDIEGYPKFKSRSRDLGHAPLSLNFALFGRNPCSHSEYQISSRYRDIEGSRNLKVGNVT